MLLVVPIVDSAYCSWYQLRGLSEH